MAGKGQRDKGIKGPLKGIKVLDLGHMGAGPVGPSLLAEWGAEVIKIEIPEQGNISRRIPPFYNDQALSFLIAGRHKKSITLDLHTEMGQEAIKRLVKEMDVVIENYRPGALERWNLGYEELKRSRDDIILVRVSGFGQAGPYRNRTSYDTVGAARGGLFYLTGFPEDPPALHGTAMCDYITASFNALAALIGIYFRNREGKGQWVDIPQYEAIFRLAEWTVAAYDKLGLIRGRTGNRHPSIAPFDLYLTRDARWVAIEALNDKIFLNLAHAMGKDELMDDPRFETAAKRAENSEAINNIVADWVGKKDLSEVVDILMEAQVPVGPAYNTKDVISEAHFWELGNIVSIEDPGVGKVSLPGLVGRFSRTPGEISDTGYPLGAHNDEILHQWLKFGKEEIAAMQKKGGDITRDKIKEIVEEGLLAPSETMKDGTPLKELRVLDIGSGLAGSFAATLMADFGAEVIKVEEPGIGDILRHLPPFYHGASLWWAVEGRNKKSLTLDLRKEKGKDIFKRLVAESDVVIESFRPGTLESWGLGYEVLRGCYQGIILVRISGFGQRGPYKDRLAGEAVASAMGGFTYINGFPDRPPVRMGYALVNYTAGIFGAMAAMAALLERDKSGEGQYVDLALYEPLIRFSRDHIPVYEKLGEVKERTGNRFSIALAGLFETKDGKWIAILAPEDKDFGRLARAMSMEELTKDPRFSTIAARKENLPLLNDIVENWVKGYNLKDMSEILDRYEVPNGAVYSIKDIFEDPHYATRGNIIEVEDSIMGHIKMQDVVPKFSLTPGRVKSTGPSLGQNNEEIFFTLLGYRGEEVAILKEEKVI